MLGDHHLAIISPATRNEEKFRWVPCKPGEIKDENSEIVDVISWIVSDVEELSENSLLVEMLRQTDRSSFNDVSELCALYNKAIMDLWHMWTEGDVVPDFYNRKASRDHIQFILLQCYNRAVSDPEKLNQYPPFSPQVYGETSFELISQMIDTIAVASDDIFIDLGSGVGQVVLQVSASTDAKFCYGIEKAEYPSYCASRLDAAFRHWMSFYGKSYRPYKLERGDFLSSEYQEKIMSASVLFANNFAFGPEVDHQLKQRFANLKEGARIISSKAFCPLNFRITDRNLGDIGSIMRVSCLNPIQDAVSWTDKPFSYYVHTIDRSLLEQYFARLKNPKSKDENQVRRDRKGRIISEVTSREGSSNSSATNNQNNNNNANHVRKRSTLLTKHHSTAFRRLPKRSASLPDVIRNSCGKSTTAAGTNTTTNNSTPNTLSKNKSSLSKKETSDHQHRHRHHHHHHHPQQRLMNGGSSSIVVRRMRSCSRQRCNARKWSSRRKRSHTHSSNNNDNNNKANKISHNTNSSMLSVENHINDDNNNDTVLLESTVNKQLASLTVKESDICDQEDTGKQFTSDISTDLLNNNPCENDLLSRSDAMKQSTRRKGKTIATVTTTTAKTTGNNNNNSNNISNGKHAYSYSVIDDCLSIHSSSSSSRGQRDSRNSSSSPYVSSLSSANRSPNSQTDETPTTLNNTTNSYSQSTLRTIQSHNCCIIPQDDLDRNMSDPSPHIRIKFRISNSTESQDHPRVGQMKPAPVEEDNMNTEVSNQVKNSSNNNTTTTTFNDNNNNNNTNNSGDDVDGEHSTSVANRRILRKCRQVLNNNNNNASYTTTNSKISNHRTIVLRKRIQKSLRNASEKSSPAPPPTTTTHTNYSPKKMNTSHSNNNNNNSNHKLKSTHKRSSRDDLHNNLDILHNHTVAHVQSKPTLTQYGLNDKRMSAYTCHYQPVDVYAENNNNPRITDFTISDIHTGHNKAPVPLALTQYLELTKQVFMDHFAMLQSPAYSSTIQSELERERNRQTELLKHIKVLEQSIAKLHTDGAELLNRFTKRLGILITTPAAFFAQARRLIKHHHALEEKIAEFRKQISELTTANQELVKRHQIEAARLLAAATANKSDNCIQHNSMNKTTFNNTVNDGRANQPRRNSGLCYDTSNISYFMTTTSMSNTTTNSITSSTIRSALHGYPTPLSNGHSSGSGSSSIIPPPPSLTKVSVCCSNSTMTTLQSNALILPHETLQYSSVHSRRSTPSTTTTQQLNTIDAPVLLKTLQTVGSFSPTMPTTTTTTAVGTATAIAVSGCDTSNTIMMSKNMIKDNRNNNNNSSNHRIIQQTNIPPPPPLLPMHIPSDIRQGNCPSSSSSGFSINASSSISVHSTSSSSTSSYQPRHYHLTDKHDPVNYNIPSLLPEITSTCYYTPRTSSTKTTYFDVSHSSSNSNNKINHLHPSKSMHASVQDLILEEFSRQTPGLSSSSGVDLITHATTTTASSVATSASGGINNVYDNVPERLYPSSPVSRHRRHHRHHRDRHHHHHSHHDQKSVHPNPIDYSHQFNLPPRKRHWDPITTSSDSLIINHSNNTINGIANGDVHNEEVADGDWLSSKFPRNNNHSCVLPKHCSSPTALLSSTSSPLSSSSPSSPLNSCRDISYSQISNNNNNNNNNLSPPTLSPISLDESSIITDCSFTLDRNDLNVSFSPSHSTTTNTNNNSNNSNTTTPIITTTATTTTNCMNSSSMEDGLGVITSTGLCKEDNSGIPQLVAAENHDMKYLPPILYSSHDHHQTTGLSSPPPTSQTTTTPSTSTTPSPVTSVTIHSNTNNPYYPAISSPPPTTTTTAAAVHKYSEITNSPGLFPVSTSIVKQKSLLSPSTTPLSS
ncbi:unnamed protein product [Trichobilharzia szidati]|nr:unnamed protein product [Trichobilharzia szidati]